ncbi:MAG: DNA/RNA nuclease SfsA, partial [Bdellovibrionaceae bacterium]|nr:DNA/RNA nuclease SfsA [Pseudobdellovibrionaceae bacterium]
KGTFLKRYKRFFADIEIDGKVEVAHVPNTGSMKGCIEPQSECLVTYNNDPERKLKYTLELIKTPTSWVGVNTSHPNALVQELWSKGVVEHWKKFDRCQKEVKITSDTRLDMAMWSSKDNHDTKKDRLVELRPPLHFIEVKNVTLASGNIALFPDSETTRGQKHLTELMRLIEQGYTCELVFVVQRQDCIAFSPADDIDPVYGKLLREAARKGLVITALPTSTTDKAIELLAQPLKVRL